MDFQKDDFLPDMPDFDSVINPCDFINNTTPLNAVQLSNHLQDVECPLTPLVNVSIDELAHNNDTDTSQLPNQEPLETLINTWGASLSPCLPAKSDSCLTAQPNSQFTDSSPCLTAQSDSQFTDSSPCLTAQSDSQFTDRSTCAQSESAAPRKRGRPRSENPKNEQQAEKQRQQREKNKRKKEEEGEELEALRNEVDELEKDEALMSKLIFHSQEIYINMIMNGEIKM